MTTPALLDRFREQVGAAAASQETAQSALVVEQNWRKEQLDANDKCEIMLHNHLKTPPEDVIALYSSTRSVHWRS